MRKGQITTSALSEIYINDIRIRHREKKDMAAWLFGIKSVLFPASLLCEAYIDGAWSDCILTGKLSDDGSGRLKLTVTFPNASIIEAGGSKRQLSARLNHFGQ